MNRNNIGQPKINQLNSILTITGCGFKNNLFKNVLFVFHEIISDAELVADLLIEIYKFNYKISSPISKVIINKLKNR